MPYSKILLCPDNIKYSLFQYLQCIYFRLCTTSSIVTESFPANTAPLSANTAHWHCLMVDRWLSYVRQHNRINPKPLHFEQRFISILASYLMEILNKSMFCSTNVILPYNTRHFWKYCTSVAKRDVRHSYSCATIYDVIIDSDAYLPMT